MFGATSVREHLKRSCFVSAAEDEVAMAFSYFVM